MPTAFIAPTRIAGEPLGFGAIQVTLDRITYKPGWTFRVVDWAVESGIQVNDGHGGWGRIWMITPGMTRSDIVRTVFLAIQVYEEHERREAFRVDDEVIYDPHEELVKEI